MQATNISWTDFSSSPIKYRDKNSRKVVWACVMASPGCQNCYSQSLAARWNKGKPFTAPNIDGVEPFVDTEELKTLLTSKKIAGKRVFIEDMSDLFGAWVPDEMIDQVFAVFVSRLDVTFQVLTKRADRMADYMGLHPWPLPNVLVGFSAENQEWFDKRAVQAAPLMRAGWNVWTSFEPLLGPITARSWNGNLQRDWLGEVGLKWAVVGGESGRGHRACEVEWITNLVSEFHDTDTPIFVKQDSGQYPGNQGRIPLEVWETKQHPGKVVAA